ncbi:MAG: hypothetical protein OXI01_24155 [Albidovulum sp.]|nr:hypothetical protein [Albidovulum sp.]
MKEIGGVIGVVALICSSIELLLDFIGIAEAIAEYLGLEMETIKIVGLLLFLVTIILSFILIIQAICKLANDLSKQEKERKAELNRKDKEKGNSVFIDFQDVKYLFEKIKRAEHLYEYNLTDIAKLDFYRNKYPEWLKNIEDAKVPFRAIQIALIFEDNGYYEGKKLVDQKIENGEI